MDNTQHHTNRLKHLGVTIELFQEATDWAAAEARRSTDFDAPALPGITFWSRTNRYLAEQLTDPKITAPPWKRTRRDSILRVVHPGGTHAITAISGTGGAGDLTKKVRVKHPKGSRLIKALERNGQGAFWTADETVFGHELDDMPLWFFLYERKDNGLLGAELSLPVKPHGKHINEWLERIPIILPDIDPGLDIALDKPDDGDDFDFTVALK